MQNYPMVTLNNGLEMPALGFGVYQIPPEETAEAVTAALQTGYRHIDTAAAYFNERQVGEAINRSGMGRSELFLETKVWISDYGADETLKAFDKAVGKLGVEHLDLLLLHQPLTTEFERTLNAYRSLEKLLDDGKVRAIGVSNFQPDDLSTLLENTTVVPAVNQIEVHPYYRQQEVLDANQAAGIHTQAWSPIGGITAYGGEQASSTFHDETIIDIAEGHGKSPAQVMLRWHLQQGRSVIPKSVEPTRIRENFDFLDFELTGRELGSIDGLDTGERHGPTPASLTRENAGAEIPGT